MNTFFSRKLSAAAEVRRIEMLFDRLPSGIGAALIGIFLCFLVLFGTVPLDTLKVWTAYMLSMLAMRAGIWYMFGKADRQSETISRWEWTFALGAFVTSLGWGALFGPLYPPATHPELQTFIALMVVITAFTGAVFVAQSNITFWLFIVPVLAPAFANYAATLGPQAYWPVIATVCCVAVVIIVQRTLYQSTTRNLNHETEVEFLLAEQQAMFDSSPLGIVVIDGKRLVKCNIRLGELLGRRIQDLAASRVDDHFASVEEAARYFAETKKTFDRGRPAQGIYRLKRADGTHFWAELSGHKMPARMTHSVWMIADVTGRVENEAHSLQPARPDAGP